MLHKKITKTKKKYYLATVPVCVCMRRCACVNWVKAMQTAFNWAKTRNREVSIRHLKLKTKSYFPANFGYSRETALNRKGLDLILPNRIAISP